MSLNKEKIKELVIYICKKSESDTKFGKVKLNKELFYIDFLSYLEQGVSVTGSTYKKLPKGPVPDCLISITKELENEKSLAEKRYKDHGYTRHQFIALREPNLDLFTSIEMELINRVILSLEPYNARTVSDMSHKFIGWEYTELNETIPYQTAFFPPPDEVKHTEEDKVYSKKLSGKYQWEKKYEWAFN